MSAASFYSAPAVVEAAAARLQQAGFEVLQKTALTINIAGSLETYERAFGRKLMTKEVTMFEGVTTTCLDSPGVPISGLLPTAGTPFADVLEGVALEVPRYFLSPSQVPPPKAYWHLRVPDGVAQGCNAATAHAYGITGQGVRVAMVDSGWYAHPYFQARGYQAAPVVLGPGAANPLHDESGHGTGESANIFAVAPGVTLLPVKMEFTNTIGAFNEAVQLNPDIITCSWGAHRPFLLPGGLWAADMALAASVAAAVARGITVIFSAGNGNAGFPGQHPDVISAGGAYIGPDGSLQASDYASGFMSLIYPGRCVPDLCGLVGMRPRAIYIMLPVEPGDQIDVDNSGGQYPDSDETAPDDGWAAFSGTSAAAPQLAGVAALIKQVAPSLPPAWVKYALMATARDVVAGSCSPVADLHAGLPATFGPDVATGSGLVDAYAAVVATYAMQAQLAAASGTAWPMAGGAPAAALDPSATAAYYQGATDAVAALHGAL
jgi:subtilisin family serine protease